MKKLKRSQKLLLELALIDFLLVFAIFLIIRVIVQGSFPRWHYLAITSFVWALSGVLTHKLEFQYFATRKKALCAIVAIDIVNYAFVYLIWKLAFPERGIILYQLWPLPIVVACECLFYLIWYRLEYQVQCLFDGALSDPYSESGMEKALQYMDNASKNSDLVAIFENTNKMNCDEACQWIRTHKQQFSSKTLVLEKGEGELLEHCAQPLDLILCLQPFNDFHHFNFFVRKANEALADGGVITLYGETSGMRRHRIKHDYPTGINYVVNAFDYLWSRVIPKLVITHKLYMKITKGRHRNFPRVEVLGRLAKAGFDICGDEILNNYFYVSAIKCRKPVTSHPSYGLFVRLPRKGKNGETIGVYKLRTMYAYAEYIQDYTYKINGLEDGGKIKDDFRVNLMGHFCRSRFLDEIPMFINFFKGELKFVGVRPISNHYLSLYSPEMQKMHLSVKPGIFPPLYYEYPKPKTIEEVQESERRYIESYLQHPRRTDWLYFWGMVRNIVFRRERSH